MFGRIRPLRVAWLCALLPLWLSCAEQDALLLALRTPAGMTVRSYSIQVQDQVAHSIIYRSGSRAVDAGRDLATSPLRVGLQLQQSGSYLVVVQASSTAGSAPAGGTAATPYFFAGLYAGTGQQVVDALLLPVGANDDADGDSFPDAQVWLKSQPQAQALYHGNLAVLDCVDKITTLAGAEPATIMPGDINPFAAPRCGVQLRPAGNPTGPLSDFDVTCAGRPQKCLDADGDGDPADTDCDDHDPSRFHGNPRPRNCCQCTDPTSCAGNHALITNVKLCSPARCGTLYDYDCTGQEVDCFVDEDCDGYSPNDPTPGQADCDDHNPSVHPGATKNCADPSHDWACDGNPQGGCVPCDLDGDGFQRMDSAAGCPDANYVKTGKPADCDDDDAGVYPGSTSNNTGASQLHHDLNPAPAGMPYATVALGGTVAGAMRGLCRNTGPDGATAQDANCDGKPYNGCPPATAGGKVCDADGDGFPNGNAGCNPNGYQLDCDDADPHSFPGAPDLCGDGKKQDCAADHACSSDSDHDGYNAADDCNDNDAAIHPWAADVCNGRDDDCDGLVDELNPDALGSPLIQTVSGTRFTTSCNDNNVGQCGQTVAPTGAASPHYTGRCVCSSVVPNTTPNLGNRAACPGTAQDASHAPKCFGAYQPLPQSCDASSPARDDDCDGRNDAPDGKNLADFGKVCGVTAGQCKAGTVVGCDRTKLNPFSKFYTPATPARSVPGWNEANRFWTCSTSTVSPVDEICNGLDDDCDGTLPANEADADKDLYMACGPCTMFRTGLLGCNDCNDADATIHPGAPELCDGKDNLCRTSFNIDTDDGASDCKIGAASSCCGRIPMCIDTSTNFGFCGSCSNACSSTTADRCTTGQCKCVSSAQCSGALPLCKAGSGCVQCLGDVNCTTSLPRCSPMNACVQCLGDTDCSSRFTIKIHCGPANACVQCNVVADCNQQTADACTGNACKCAGGATCTGATPFCKAATGCVQCLNDAACTVPGKTHCSAAGSCVECTTDGQCGGATPHCSAAGACVQCNTAAECNSQTADACVANVCKCEAAAPCSGATPYCLAGTGCVVCASDADCAGMPGQTHCKTTTGQCVACTADNQCTGQTVDQCASNACVCEGKPPCSGATPYCLAGTGCVVCVSDADCAGVTGKTHCKTTTGQCVACTADNQCTGKTDVCAAGVCTCDGGAACSGATPLCLAGTGCVQCVSYATDCNHKTTDQCAGNACKCDGGAACSGATPYCLMGSGCVACASDTDCAGVTGKTHCDTGTGACVQCTTAAQCNANTANVCTMGACMCDAAAACSGATPFCLPGTGCVVCRNDGDCPMNTTCDPVTFTCG